MDHKAKCKKLKSIRKSMADKLGVDLHQTECTYQGECKGTCPKCRQEEEILNRALLTKGSVAVAAVAASISLAGCGPFGQEQIAGGMDYVEPTDWDDRTAGEVAEPWEDDGIGDGSTDCSIDESGKFGEDESACPDTSIELEGDVDIVETGEYIIEGDIEFAPADTTIPGTQDEMPVVPELPEDKE